jgi:diguanylate cyclase (GGDEF)-like protein
METALRKRGPEEGRPSPSEWALVVYAGVNLGRVFSLQPGENLIGRSPQVGITLLDEEVSRVHSCVRMDTLGPGMARIYLEDRQSTNGTFLNGHPVDVPRLLAAGDRIAIGSHILKLVAMDPLERAFHETLLDQSTKDPLTGLGNRGATLAELQSRFDLSRRHGRPISVIMCDLDHFKKINDEYGHGAGDIVLAGFGDRVRVNLRGTDLAGRIGGEEFLLVLPETDLDGALLLAERLRASIGDTPYSLPSGPLPVTCSLGVAERAPEDRDAGVLLGRADEALYTAKREGRNRTSVARTNP